MESSAEPRPLQSHRVAAGFVGSADPDHSSWDIGSPGEVFGSSTGGAGRFVSDVLPLHAPLTGNASSRIPRAGS